METIWCSENDWLLANVLMEVIPLTDLTILLTDVKETWKLQPIVSIQTNESHMNVVSSKFLLNLYKESHILRDVISKILYKKEWDKLYKLMKQTRNVDFISNIEENPTNRS